MDWRQAFERFHDENRYFVPLMFIGLILVATGAVYNSTVVLESDVVVDRTLLFDGKATIQAVTLRPGWRFNIEVVANKPINLSLTNLMGRVVAESTGPELSYTADFLDLYFINVHGSDYAVLDFDYTKSGRAPYPMPYLFFGSGLMLMLGVIIYHLLEPWLFKFKRKLEFVDAVFYPFMFVMVSIVFWVFRDSLMWFIPKNYVITAVLIIIPLLIIAGCTLILWYLSKGKKVFLIAVKTKRAREFFKVLYGFIIAYSAIFLTIVIKYSGLINYSEVIIPLVVACFLAWLFFATKTRNALVIFLMTWLISVLMRFLVYSIGVPVIFDTFLAAPADSGKVPLFIALSSFIVLGIYFLARGYYAKNTPKAINYGLYAGIFFQAFMQVFSGSSLL